MVEQKIHKLQEFFVANHIKHSKINIEYCERNGFSVKALVDLKEGDSICKIPKEAILSVRNTAIADIIEELNFGGILGLSLAVMYEASLGEKSPWYNYLSSIPSFANVPLFWSNHELALLKNTDVGRALEEDRQLLTDDFNDHIKPVLESNKYPLLDADFITQERWFHVASLVSSRAFQVDEWHGECLVPLSDLFNHKSGDENVHFESVSDVCDMCGASNGCGCYGEDEDPDEEEVPTLQEEEDASAALNADAETEVDDTILEMVIVKPVSAGEEVFNTYGPHGNSSLLRLYGFVDEKNEFSSVSVSRDEILNALSHLPTETLKERVAFWDEVGKSMVEDIDMIDSEDGTGNHVHTDDFATDDDEMDGEDVSDTEDDENNEAFDDCCEDENCGGCQEDDEEQFPDDFYFENRGVASFSLNAFINLLLMSDELYEIMSTQLETAIQMLVSIKEPKENSKGKAVSSPLQSLVKETQVKLAKQRLAGYDSETSEDTQAAKYASMLKAEEQIILNNFIKLNA